MIARAGARIDPLAEPIGTANVTPRKRQRVVTIESKPARWLETTKPNQIYHGAVWYCFALRPGVELCTTPGLRNKPDADVRDERKNG